MVKILFKTIVQTHFNSSKAATDSNNCPISTVNYTVRLRITFCVDLTIFVRPSGCLAFYVTVRLNMENLLVKVSNNWTQIGGCTANQCIQMQTADPDIFLKGDSSDFCELYLEIFPHYKIQAVSFVCNVMKVEIFQGPIKEYLETIYGTIAEESDEQFKSYRYDIEVEKSGITHLTIRFLTDSLDVCVFGLMLHVAPNPNGITTLLPNTSCINIRNIESVLQKSSKHTEHKSEKCKQLLELLGKRNQSNALALEQLMENKINITDKVQGFTFPTDLNEDCLNQLKLYIDERFNNMELRINKQLDDMEQRQMQKLDNILYLLQKTQNNKF
ncbi:uncharacterized protein ACRADG_000261 isoform 2-T2 [Cochliomyia hominivorax]